MTKETCHFVMFCHWRDLPIPNLRLEPDMLQWNLSLGENAIIDMAPWLLENHDTEKYNYPSSTWVHYVVPRKTPENSLCYSHFTSFKSSQAEPSHSHFLSPVLWLSQPFLIERLKQTFTGAERAGQPSLQCTSLHWECAPHDSEWIRQRMKKQQPQKAASELHGSLWSGEGRLHCWSQLPRTSFPACCILQRTGRTWCRLVFPRKSKHSLV